MNSNSVRPLAFAAIALLMAGCTAAANREATAPNAVQAAADQAVAGGRMTEAADYYLVALNQNPGDPDLRLRTAMALRAANRPGDALTTLDPLTKQASAPPAALVEAARAALQADRAKTALDFAKRAVDRQPSDPAAQTVFGIALNANGMHAEADKAYQAALANGASDVAPILNNLGLSEAQQGRMEEALATLHRAESIDPKNPITQDNLKLVQAIATSALQPSIAKPTLIMRPAPIPAKPVAEIMAPASPSEPLKLADAKPVQAPMQVAAKPMPITPAIEPKTAPVPAPVKQAQASKPTIVAPIDVAPTDVAPIETAKVNPTVSKPAESLTPSEQLSLAALNALKAAPHNGSKPIQMRPADSIVAEPVTPVMMGGESIIFRYGHEAGRDRLVLDNADNLNAKASIADGNLTLTLPVGSQVKLSVVDSELAHSVSAVNRSMDGSQLTMTLKPGVRAKTYRLGDRLVVDFKR